MISEEIMSNAYAMFAFLASLCCLWAMQKVTLDANLHTWIGRVKWCHRAAIALASGAFATSAAYALYYDMTPQPINFLLIFVLLAVLVLSVMRHMTAPVARDQGRLFYSDQSR